MTVGASRFFTGSYLVKRQKPGTYVLGNYESGGEDEVSIQGSLQPLSGKEIKMLEEGFRMKQLYKLYSDQPILLINTKSLANSDVVLIDGETYRVLSVEHWKNFRIEYYKSTLVRQPEQ